jgi:uncharacterized protein
MKYKVTIFLTFIFVSATFSQVQIVEVPNPGFEERITSSVNEIRIIDTHEHLATEESRIQSAKDIDFTYLFSHYAKEDLISASNNKGLVEIIYNTDFPLSDRWELFEPYYNAMRSTGYGRVPLIIARDLYGISEINESTIKELSAKIRNASKPGFYEYVLKDKAKIDLSIQDMGHQNYDKNFYRHVERFSQFALVSSGSEIRNFGEQYNTPINSIKDYLKLLRMVFVKGVNSGMVGVKTGAAYLRILKFENVSKERGEEVFKSLLNNSQVSTEDIKAVQDFLMHRMLDLVDEFDLPIQIHTGLQAGNGNIITNSNPTHLANLFMEYPDIDFILFHGGYPYGGELGTLAKNFPNVFIDMCWTYVISPSYSERYLHEWIETIPSNKIMGFGGDYSFVEAVYAHSVMARQTIANVLIEKVRTRYLSENEAIEIAKMILRENALRIFKLDGKSHSTDELNVFKRPGPIRDWWEISRTNNGFVRSWKVIGSFDYGKGLENIYPPENEIQFDQSYSGKGGLVKWETENISSSGYLNLISIMSKRNSEISPRAEGIAYAYTEVNSPNDREVKITLGSNDGAKMWINNEVIYNKHVARNAVADQDLLSVKFNKGKNKILVKIENIGASWGLYLRIVDPKDELEFIQFED